MLPDWAGLAAVCIASGPSLTAEDCEAVRASGRPTVVTNTTFRSCDWAHVLFGHDATWWKTYIDEVKRVFSGRLFCTFPSVRNIGVEWAQGREFCSFGMSGTDAISLAIAAGSRQIVLLGYDCQFVEGRSHHHGDHPPTLSNCASMHQWPAKFGRLARYAKAKGASVLNASRATALDCFDRGPLESCL